MFPSTKDQHPSLKSNSKRPSTVITSSRQPLINENSVLHRDFLKFLSDNNIKVTHSSPPKVTSATSSPRVCSQRIQMARKNKNKTTVKVIKKKKNKEAESGPPSANKNQ